MSRKLSSVARIDNFQQKNDDKLFGSPQAICVSKDGKLYYVTNRNKINVMSDGIVSTLAVNRIGKDGKVEAAEILWPRGIAISDDGKIYITDARGNQIRMISNGMVSTPEQNRLQTQSCEEDHPSGICISHDGKIYVTDWKYMREHKVLVLSDGNLSVVASFRPPFCRENDNATTTTDTLTDTYGSVPPSSICISDDQKIYFPDKENNCIRMISDGIVSVIAGCGLFGYQDGDAEIARFWGPHGICLSKDGKIYVTDSHNNRIRMISDGMVSTIAGCAKKGFQDGIAEDAMFDNPTGICISNEGKIYVCDSANNRIRVISDGIVSTITSNGIQLVNVPHGICISENGEISVTNSRNHPMRIISGKDTVLMQTREFSENLQSIQSHFDLSLLLHSESLSDMTLTINNHQYHLHTAVMHSLCPMVVKHISIIEDAKISNESLQTMFEMIYSNNHFNPTKIRKSIDQYEITDLRLLVELIWLFESFEIKNEFLVENIQAKFYCLKEYERHKSMMETFYNEFLVSRADELMALGKLHGLQTTNLVELISHLKKPQKKSGSRKTATLSIYGMFTLLGLNTEPRVVRQPQIKSVITKSTLNTQPDYTIMTHDRSYSIKCHKLILYAKWSYFRRMIESGLLESASGEMIMSEDWNATRLFDFIKYLYTHEVGFESIEDAQWLLDNAELYELMQKPKDQDRLAESLIPKYEYKWLIKECIKKSESINMMNCCYLYKIALKSGNKRRMQECYSFLVSNAIEYMQRKDLAKKLMRFGPEFLGKIVAEHHGLSF